MSEQLSTVWATSPEMEFWREQVRAHAEAALAENPLASKKIEISDPEKAARGLYMLASGKKWSEIESSLGINRSKISALQTRHIGSLEQYRPVLAKRLTMLASRMADTMEAKLCQIEDSEEELSKTSLKDIAISSGITIQNASLLSGNATSVVEHRSGPTLEDAMAFRDSIRQRIADKAKDGAIDV